MELPEKISALQSSAENQLPALSSQKRTETALILPFFNALGFDPFDVREVEPEFNVGLGDQGMRTVDYALKREGAPLMLFQCEEAKTDLEGYDSSFLFEHFDRLVADVAVFTNGLQYRFYANLGDEINVSQRPFLEFDLMKHGSEHVEELNRLRKPVFDAEEILSSAYAQESGQLLRSYFAQQFEAPDEHFVRFLAAQIFEGEVSEDILDRFQPVVQRILGEYVDGETEITEPEPVQGDGSKTPPPEKEPLEKAPEQEDVELTPSDEDVPSDGDEEDPFEKDLARRVIDNF
jgi:hypothetical protein